MNKNKPTSPGIRWKIKRTHKPKKRKIINKLTKLLNSKGGRNNRGRITTKHRGSIIKKKYRLIDFKRNKKNISGIVKRIEYDPNRNCNIVLVLYKDGEKRYILETINQKINDVIYASNKTEIKIGNNLMIKYIPIGIKICCIENIPGKGAKYSRSAGTFGIIIKKEINESIIKLKSSELKKINNKCTATIGIIANVEFKLNKLGKAGINRLLGFRSKVRGVAMNPVDHPHGGGEGKTSTKRHPVNKNGLLTKGFRTRKNKRTNNKIIKYRYEKK